MPTIPPELSQRLRNTLVRCSALESDRAMRAVFVDVRLAPWINNIPENTTSRTDRVALLIAALCDQTSIHGDNALVLLLDVLAEQTPEDVALHNDLIQLTDQFRRYSSANTVTLTVPEHDMPVPVRELKLPSSSVNAPAVSKRVLRVEFDWITIPAGTFWMGSDQQIDSNARDNEKPLHPVEIPEYCIARVPVTNAQYKLFLDKSGHRHPETWKDGNCPEDKSNHPVTVVSWYDAQAFCAWAGVCLPTEAEWEKAARGTDGRIFPWGNESPDQSRCNSDMNVGDTTPVGAYPLGASPYGVLDMAGNVWEFTSDLLKPYPYSSTTSDKSGTERNRVLRGGAFDDFYWYMRCAVRSRFYSAKAVPGK